MKRHTEKNNIADGISLEDLAERGLTETYPDLSVKDAARQRLVREGQKKVPNSDSESAHGQKK